MKKAIYSIYNYYDTLLSQLKNWNENILIGHFDSSASNLTEALGIDTSDGRSRAKEMYRIGLLTHELTKGDNALNLIRNDNNIQSSLGFITSLIYRQYSNQNSKLYAALGAINAIFSIVQSISIGDVSISINTLIYKLQHKFPCPDDIDTITWLRYALSGFFCEVDYGEEKVLESLNAFLKGESGELCLRIIQPIDRKSGSVNIRAEFSNSDELRKVIMDRVSLTNIYQQKRPLFTVGTTGDDSPRGFYGFASKLNTEFLRVCAELEQGHETDSPFKPLYIDDESTKSQKGYVLEFLANFSNYNDKFKFSFSEIMKTIETGAIEALSQLTNKPIDFFYKKISYPDNGTALIHQVLLAIRTKPFILLAGISGTGKSRIVLELAFKSCPKYLQDIEGTSPGNYCMIEVKPNWHDSTELLGYYSNLSKSYQFKKFVKFLVKAKMFPDVPFFVCLDEMNLAPVEQYFAEFLSILETRKHPKKADGGVDMSTISTGVIIEPKYFRELSTMSSAINQQTGEAFEQKLTDRDIYLKLFNIDSESDINEDVGSRTDLTTIGLTLPDNVIIIGTVNMDDTTHQFSRKVIDRAMTIEMNGGKLVDMFGGSKDLEYIKDEEEQKKWQHSFSQRYVTADEVLETHPEQAEGIKRILPERLEVINRALKGTPFEVSYRVLNELTIMVGVMLDEKKSTDGTIDDTVLDDIINQAVNNILLMKILPRIEGDAEMFALSKAYKDKLGITYNDRLEWLKALAPDIVQAEDTQDESGEDNAGAENESEEKPEDQHAHQQTAKDKIQEMIDRLNNQDFTRFWP